MKRLGQLLSLVTWLLVAGSVVIITGGMIGRPLLLAAVPTGSMVPVLRPGDLIVVLPTWAVHSPRLDDIVVFKTPKDQDWVVHRIIDGNETEGFVTKGDANRSADPHRVRPQDVAGMVPVVRGEALRFPRLGLLSLEAGPLSSPVVAGTALVMGVYLLALDMRPRVKSPLGFRGKSARATPKALLTMYAGLAVTVFLTTLIPAWTLSSRQAISYEVVSQKVVGDTLRSQYLIGKPQREDMVIQNPSPFPLVVTVNWMDSHVIYEPEWLVVPAGSSRKFVATIANPNLGAHRSDLLVGTFLPLLPPAVLAWLTRQSLGLAAVASALVPALIILLLSLVDSRSRAGLYHLRNRLRSHFL